MLSLPLLAALLAAPTDDLLRAVQADRLAAHMKVLAADDMEGRATGTPAHTRAADYVADQLRAYGLTPAGTEGFLQPVPLIRAEAAGPAALVLGAGAAKTSLRDGQDFTLLPNPFAAEVHLEAPLVFAGHGIIAPELGHDDYAGLDVRGAVVVVFSGTPSRFSNEARVLYQGVAARTAAAVAHGARGLLMARSPAAEKSFPWPALREVYATRMGWRDASGRFRSAYRPDQPQLEVVGVLSRKASEELFRRAKRPYGEVLRNLPGGKTPGFALPRAIAVHARSQVRELVSSNVAAVLPGSDPAARDGYVVVSAHLDHVGIGTPRKGDRVYNGALDNASGVAMLLEIARVLAAAPQPPRRSVLFLAVTGEEEGLLGSEYFAGHPTVPRAALLANVNLDMPLIIHPLRDLVVYGLDSSTMGAHARHALDRLGLAASPDPEPEQVYFSRSDQYSFVRQGVPAIYADVGRRLPGGKSAAKQHVKWLQERYHQPQDDLAQPLDDEAGAVFALFNLAVTWGTADDADPPRWIPGDFYADRFGRTPGEPPPAAP